MKQPNFNTLPTPPQRPERQNAPLAPRLMVEIARLLRARMASEDQGVMSQSTARLVMSHLAMQGTMGQLELVRLTHLKPPTVSVLLRRMEEEGYIIRTADEKDRRASCVTLTEKGYTYDREQLRRLSTNDDLAMRGLSKKECETLEALLLRVRNNLKNEEEKA